MCMHALESHYIAHVQVPKPAVATPVRFELLPAAGPGTAPCSIHRTCFQDTGVMGLLGHRWTTVPMQDAGLIAQRSLEVRLLGDLSLAPATVQEAAAGVVEASKQLKRRCGVLNIMFSYTSTHELARALATRSACVRANAARMDSENPPQHRSGGGVDAGVRDVAGHLVVRCASGLHGGEEGLGRACRVCRRMGGTSASHTACGHLEWCVAEGMGTGIRQRLLPAGPAGARNGVCPLSRDQLASCLEGARRDSHAVRVAVQCCHGASAAGAASARAGVGCCSLPRSPRPASSKPGHEGSWGGTQGLLEAVDAALLTAGSPPVDLLIRTSDESRLSDFLVWQCRGAQLAWVPELWPAFSFATFVRCILNWQMHLPALACIRRALACGRSCEQPV